MALSSVIADFQVMSPGEEVWLDSFCNENEIFGNVSCRRNLWQVFSIFLVHHSEETKEEEKYRNAKAPEIFFFFRYDSSAFFERGPLYVGTGISCLLFFANLRACLIQLQLSNHRVLRHISGRARLISIRFIYALMTRYDIKRRWTL